MCNKNEPFKNEHKYFIRITLLLVIFLLTIAFYGCTSNNSMNKMSTPPIKTETPTNIENEEGTVKIVSNNEEILPYKSWSYGESVGEDGQRVSADGLEIDSKGIEDKLETIKYTDDFEIKIDGYPSSVMYMTYNKNFVEYEACRQYVDKPVIPTDKGTYIMRIMVSWEANNSHQGYDYVFKLLIE